MFGKLRLFRNPAAVCINRSFATSIPPFPVIEDALKSSDIPTETIEKSHKLLAQLEKINQICYNGGGEKGRKLHTERNKKVLPRERVAQLFDDDADTLELSLQAGLGLEYGDIPAAGSISVIGRIHGRYCIVSANDATLKGGTFFPISVVKSTRAQTVALMNSLPSIYIVDSGGAFLALQSEIFPDKKHGGRGFYTQAILSEAGIPQIAMVSGSCTAGGAYVPMMCEDSGMVDKIGTMFLGGPPLVKAAVGEVVSAEDLGGATMHTSISGCSDYFAETEAEGYQMIRDTVATLDITPSSVQSVPVEPLYPTQDLDHLCGLEILDKKSVLSIISRLVDGSRFREFKQRYGENLVTGYGFIDARRVGIIVNCGPITKEDGLKGAHFIQICQHRNMPIIFLQNSGPLLSSEGSNTSEGHSTSNVPSELIGKNADSIMNQGENGLLLRARGSMAATVASATVPKVAININGCHGDDNYTMCGPGFEPNFNFTWPGANVTHSMDGLCTKATDGGAKQSRSAFNFEQDSCWYHASRALNDGIIKPSDTRLILSKCLRVFDQKKRLTFHHKQFPVLRF